jgi:CheY-like chemotaxis protein/HAMP domain-containing protein
VRSFLRGALGRLGLTGKLVLLAGSLLAVSLAALLGALHLRGRAVVRGELRTTELVRIDRWAAAHREAVEGVDRWKLAGAVEALGRDPYVVYAGLFDRAGRLIAQTGDPSAHLAPHALDLLVALRAGPEGRLAGSFMQEAEPLPGLAPDPLRAERAVPFSERFRGVLAGEGRRSEDLLGWVEVTLDAGPLDAILRGVLLQLAAGASALVLVGVLLTWGIARRAAGPLRLLAADAALIAEGRLDEPFDQVPRPSDEVGELATRFSVMASRLRRDRERLRRVVHDLKTPLTSIRAFAEILEEGDGVAPEERARFLGRLHEETLRMERMLDGLLRAEAAGASAGDGSGRARILVASGDAVLRSLVKEAAAGEGREVLEAADAGSVLRAAREGRPEAVVLDLLMDRGAGLTALGDLAGDERTVEITVLPLGVVRDGEAIHAGPVYFHPKPIDRERFLATVRKAIAAESPGPGRVLVADDDRFVAEAVRSILAREGLGARVAAGGEEALRAAAEEAPDLAVLDLTMPDLDGVEVLRRLRARPETRGLPVILMTAHRIPDGAAVPWSGASVSRETFVSGIRAALRAAAPR